MLWTTLFLAFLIAAGAAAFVLWPLFSRAEPDALVEDDRLTDLISRKDSVLVAIKDLEFDRQVGKLSQEDYERFNARLRQQAIAYLQQIDKLAPQSAHLDEALEAEIARQRKTRTTLPATRNGKAAAIPEEAVPVYAGEIPARFCTNCGQPLAPTHKFCAQCGTAV